MIKYHKKKMNRTTLVSNSSYKMPFLKCIKYRNRNRNRNQIHVQ